MANLSEIDIIKQDITIVKNKYKNSAIDIVRDYNAEQKTMLDYKGRQIFELLQNADDCYESACNEIKVKFTIENDKLIVQNTGIPFTARGIVSLMNPDASSKHQGTIGCKGLGFRSVLNWTKKIYICTTDFCVLFSEEKAKEDLLYYRKNCLNRSEELDGISRTAILSSAEIIEGSKLGHLEKGFSTAIILFCDNETIDKIQEQLLSLKFEELLFLKHINEIIIDSPQIKRDIVSIKDEERVMIQDGEVFSDWRVWNKRGLIKEENGSEKEYDLTIAYNNDSEQRENLRKNGVLYSYFKTDIRMPFPFIIHGTFNLTSERNYLVKEDKANEQLIDLLIDFIGEKGESLAKNNENIGYDALKFLLPSAPLVFLDKEYNFTNKLKEKVKEYKVFPTIANEYISIKNNPKYSENRFDIYVNPTTFHNLLIYCDDVSVKGFIKECTDEMQYIDYYSFSRQDCISFYNETEMVDLLNKNAVEYIKKGYNIKLIELFEKQYPSYNFKQAPKLLTDINCEQITDDGTVFNKPDGEFDLPSWGKMRFLNKELEKELRNTWHCNVHSLMEKLSRYGCSEYSFKRVLSELVKQSKENIEKTKELIKWLFNHWEHNNNSFEIDIEDVNIGIITREGKFIYCSQAYLGEEYGNNIGERITSSIETDKFVIPKEELGFENVDLNLFKNFLKDLGAAEYPRIIPTPLGIDRSYIEYNSQKYSTLYIGSERYTHKDLFYQPDGGITVDSIKDIKKVFESCSTEELLAWVLMDSNLYKHIINENEINSESKMLGYPYRKQYAKEVKTDQMRSYLRWIFTETNWIRTKTNGVVNSHNCTILPNNINSIIGVVDVDYDCLSKIMGNRLVKKDVESFFEKIGVSEDIVDLPKEKLYEILLKLPEIDKDYTIGKQVYTKYNLKFDNQIVIQITNNNKKYEEYKKSGKVLTKFNERYEYKPIKDAYYVGKKIYSDDILKNYPIFVLNRRAGDDKVNKLFGVKSIKNIGGISVESERHMLDSAFQKEYRQLLPYIYTKRIGVDKKNKELNLLKNSSITLVGSATTKHEINGTIYIGVLKDYELIYSDKKAFIKIPNSIDSLNDLKKEMRYRGALAEVITTIIDVDGDKDSFMMIFGCSSQREIEQYFQENGDISLTTVNLAKAKFAQQIDDETEFWNAISSIMNESEEELKVKCNGFISKGFNYHEFSDKEFESIIKLFEFLKIDVQNYNEIAFKQIDITPFFEKQFKEIKRRYRDKYFYYKANCLLQVKGDKKDFEKGKKEYDFYSPKFENSIKNDVYKTLENFLGISLENLNSYDTDYLQLLEKLPSEEKIVSQTNYRQEDTHKNVENPIDYIYINETIKSSTTDESTRAEITNIKKENYIKIKHVETESKHVFNSDLNLARDINGFKAESKVYNTLKTKLGAQLSIEWVSGNGEKAGVIEKGDDSCGYDMKYVDSKGDVHYIEVKGTSGENLEFTISKKELEFAQSHKYNYEIWFVFIKDNVPQIPNELGNIFNLSEHEDFFNNSKFTVEQHEYKIKAKIIN